MCCYISGQRDWVTVVTKWNKILKSSQESSVVKRKETNGHFNTKIWKKGTLNKRVYGTDKKTTS